jgi:hypothetical protein
MGTGHVLLIPSSRRSLVAQLLSFHNMDIIAELKKIPPVTRFIFGFSLVLTGATIANITLPYPIIFAKELVLKRLRYVSFLRFKISFLICLLY